MKRAPAAASTGTAKIAGLIAAIAARSALEPDYVSTPPATREDDPDEHTDPA